MGVRTNSRSLWLDFMRANSRRLNQFYGTTSLLASPRRALATCRVLPLAQCSPPLAIVSLIRAWAMQGSVSWVQESRLSVKTDG